MGSIENVLRAVYDRVPGDVQPKLRRSYRWARIRAEAARTRMHVHPSDRVVFQDFDIAQLEAQEILGPAAGDVLVETCFSAISPGTETSILCGWPGTPRRFPYVPGYSAAGTVAAVGASVRGFAPGDRVAGGLRHASRDSVAAHTLVKVPAAVSLHDASFAVLGVISLQGVRKAKIQPGERVAVVGQGLVGQLARRLAAVSHPSAIIAIGASRAREALARADGHEFVALSEGDACDTIEADVVFEAAGTADAITTSLRCAAPGGRVVILGSGRTLDRSAAWVRLVQERNLSVIGAHLTTVADREASAARFTFQQEAALFLDLIRRGKLRVDDFVTWRVRPDECNAVYEQLASGKSKHVGIVFAWRPEPTAQTDSVVAPPPLTVAPPPTHARPATKHAAVAPLKLGIVGLGAIGQEHARQASKAALVDVVALYDTNQKVSNQLATKLSATSYRSYEELLDRPDIEAVLLAVPNYLHKDMAVQAAAHGKHVLLEKPMAITMQEADDILAACHRHRVALSLNFSFRYLPRVTIAKRFIDAGALGDITGVQALVYSFRESGYWHGARSASADDWRTSKEKSGAGFFFMNLCHVIDYLYFMTGMRATRVYCEHGTLGSPTEVDDSVSLTCRFENGGIGSIAGSSIRRGGNQAEERLWGSHGTLTIDDEAIRVHSTRVIDGMRPGKTHTISKLPMAGWIGEWLDEFTTATREGREPAITGRDGWENLAFITTALRSMDERQALDIPRYPGTGG
jgi:2-desacetyl-2-hydroxyethyl bacteriochlorophyllide A dehydrogenase